MKYFVQSGRLIPVSTEKTATYQNVQRRNKAFKKIRLSKTPYLLKFIQLFPKKYDVIKHMIQNVGVGQRWMIPRN